MQHQDGHSHLTTTTIPNCVAYDPCYAYELAVIIQDGLRRMYQEGESIFYYVTVMNENYLQPEMPEASREGIIKGMYALQGSASKAQVQLLGSGTILREVIAAADLLATDFNIASQVWSVTSFSELRKDGLAKQRWNLLHPQEPARKAYVDECLDATRGPVIAASDYMKIVSDQIRPFLSAKRSYTVLGTDGFGRSDRRSELRRFFEVDRHYVAYTALKALADSGDIPVSTVLDAMQRYGIDPEKPDPTTV